MMKPHFSKFFKFFSLFLLFSLLLVFCTDGWMASQSVGWLVGRLAMRLCIIGWAVKLGIIFASLLLVGWLSFGWLVGWLVGSIFTFHPSPFPYPHPPFFPPLFISLCWWIWLAYTLRHTCTIHAPSPSPLQHHPPFIHPCIRHSSSTSIGRGPSSTLSPHFQHFRFVMKSVG
ncbi:hypothetical protein IWX49DRAFT_237245 [Phyllosticta citricarpa]|uniref:Uncharacterized protein n=2 Tax=Phyllosticta TaxID=121621 RepID=A0ABR1MIC6_9PEZI